MATRLARRHRVFAVVALVAVLVALLGPWRTAVQAAPTTEPSPPGRNPDLEFPTEPLKAQLPNVAFPVTLVGETTVEDVKVFNDGGSSVLVSDVTVSGDEFRVAMNGCENVNLGPQESCTIAVAFSPASESEVDGLLTAMVDGEPLTSQLTGTGVGVPSSVPPPATSPATTGAPGTDPVPPVSTVPSPPTTGDTVPTDPGEESEDLNARKRECERIARRAEVRYPDALEMTVGRESSVTVTVTLEGEPPPSSVEGTPDTVVDSATLTCFVTAVLSGSNFDIDPTSQSGDFVLSATIDWQWDVIPKTTGRHDLDLRIIPQVGVGADSNEGTPRTFQADITVTAEPRSAWQVVSDLVSDVAQNPLFQFLVAAGVLSGIGAAIRKKLGAAIAERRNKKFGTDDHKSGYL